MTSSRITGRTAALLLLVAALSLQGCAGGGEESTDAGLAPQELEDVVITPEMMVASETVFDPEITDGEYDALLSELEALEREHADLVTADSPTQRVAGEPTEGFETIEHVTPMLSLDNTYSPEEHARMLARDDSGTGAARRSKGATGGGPPRAPPGGPRMPAGPAVRPARGRLESRVGGGTRRAGRARRAEPTTRG